jgi:hypothetical protein
VKFNNPIRGKLVLPADCFDLTSFEWAEPVTVTVPRPKKSFKDFERTVAAVELAVPVQFKSLGDSLNELVAAVMSSYRWRTVNPLRIDKI